MSNNEKHNRVINLITEISNSNPIIEDIFLNGSCCNFYFILKSVFPESVAYFNIEHVITKIGNRYYDITGEISLKEFSDKKYMPINEFYPNKYKDDKSIKSGEMYSSLYKHEYVKEPI